MKAFIVAVAMTLCSFSALAADCPKGFVLDENGECVCVENCGQRPD